MPDNPKPIDVAALTDEARAVLAEACGMDVADVTDAAVNVASRDIARRSLAIEPATVDRVARTIEAVMATEDPVPVWDWHRVDIVDEVLLMSGVRLSKVRRGKVPLLDSHMRDTARNVLGSVRDLRTEAGKLLGREFWSKLAGAEFEKSAEGHLDQRSVGYRVRAATYVEPGESATVDGRTFTAGVRALKVVTDWEVKELSVVPLAADPAAGTRAAPEAPAEAPTVSATDPTPDTGDAVPEPAQRAQLETPTMPENTIPTPAAAPAVDVDAIRRAEVDRTRTLHQIAEPHIAVDGVMDARDEAVTGGATPDQFRAVVLDLLAKATPPAATVTVTEDEADKVRAAMIEGLSIRARVPGVDQAAANDFRSCSLLMLARECLERRGVNTRRMPDLDIARRAIHTTSDFPYVLANVANKSLLAAYSTFPATWPKWCQRMSVADFRAHSVARFSESGVLSEVPEGAEFPYHTMTEDREQVTAKTYGAIFSITRQAIVNDDLSAFQTIAVRHGRSWARTVEVLAVTRLLNTSTTMTDGVVLFDTSTHGNLDTSTTTITTKATAEGVIRALRKLIVKQTDEAGTAILGLMPKIIMTGPTLYPWHAQAALENRGATPATVDVANLNMVVIENPWIESTTITGNGTNQTYMFCDPADAPVMAVGFIGGADAPTLEEYDRTDDIDGVKYKVRGDVAVGVVDYRGAAKHVL